MENVTLEELQAVLGQKDHEIKLLANALGECIEAAGITRPSAGLTGPELLMFADDLKRHLAESAALANESAASDRELITKAIGFEFAQGELQTVNEGDLLRLVAAARGASSPSASAPLPSGENSSCVNEWFASLSAERQAVLREDKWMLVGAAFKAGQASSSISTGDERAMFKDARGGGDEQLLVEANYYRATLCNVLKDIRDDLAPCRQRCSDGCLR